MRKWYKEYKRQRIINAATKLQAGMLLVTFLIFKAEWYPEESTGWNLRRNIIFVKFTLQYVMKV